MKDSECIKSIVKNLLAEYDVNDIWDELVWLFDKYGTAIFSEEKENKK